MDEKTVMAETNEKSPLVEKRCREILDAARRIFAQKGFRVATIDDIATNLSIGKGTIYRYFSDKKSLFIAVFEDGMKQLLATMRTRLEPVLNPSEKVRYAVKTYFEFFDANPELIEISMQVRSEFKDEHQRISIELYGDYIQRIKENLRNGVACGTFRQLNVDQTADVMSATLQGVLQSFYVLGVGEKSEGREKLSDRTEAVSGLILEGLLKR